MGAAFRCIDAVGKGKNILRVGVIVLDGNLDIAILPGAVDIDGTPVQNFFVPVQVFDEG